VDETGAYFASCFVQALMLDSRRLVNSDVLPPLKMLTDTFAHIRRSIVALAIADKRVTAPSFPTIIGTGFVIDTQGIVVTNRHVVLKLEELVASQPASRVALALTFSEVQREEDAVVHQFEI
jgi:S1-C subfamily serine protease